MTLSEIADSLPWDFHDAHLESLQVDWPHQRLVMTLRLPITERQDMELCACVTVNGLAYCSIEAPVIAPKSGYMPTPACGLWVDFGCGPAYAEVESRLPPTPEGCFLNWFFVHDWNRAIHVCGRDAQLGWLDLAPVPARSGTRALFPGEEVPDPPPAPTNTKSKKPRRRAARRR
ncbi:MAG: hypothetical protein QM765_20630 [Myxococcales bacterium]